MKPQVFQQTAASSSCLPEDPAAWHQGLRLLSSSLCSDGSDSEEKDEQERLKLLKFKSSRYREINSAMLLGLRGRLPALGDLRQVRGGAGEQLNVDFGQFQTLLRDALNLRVN